MDGSEFGRRLREAEMAVADALQGPGLGHAARESNHLLESQEVEALFELSTAELTEWLDATYRITPVETGMAGLDWDGFLLRLLGGPEVPGEPARPGPAGG